MGKLVRIEVENFKSYKGHQIIGPFHNFTSVIGPNGSGKSNLMDAISFVLGIHAVHLRSQNLKDMIYRSSALRQDEHVTSSRQPQHAHVMAVYQTTQGQELRFMRIVNRAGQSDYRLNGKTLTYAEYNKALEKENILVNAKNFLVFQGDVESVASQNPVDLTRLIEQISGSSDFKEEYETLKKEQERAIENSAHAFNKKRAVTAEIKQYQEQKTEADKFEALVHGRKALVVQYLLWKLFHSEQKTRTLEQEAGAKRVSAGDATEEQINLEERFKVARKEQATVHLEKIRREMQIKKAKHDFSELRPASIGIDEKIAHLQKRLEQTKNTGERVKRDHDREQQTVETLERDLVNLGVAAQTYETSLPSTETVRGPVLTPDQMVEYQQLKQQVSRQAVEEQQQYQTLQRQHKMEVEDVGHQRSKLEESKTRLNQLVEDRRQVTEDSTLLVADHAALDKQLAVRKQEASGLARERTSIYRKEVELNEKLQQTLNKLLEVNADQRESDKERRMNESLAMMKQIFPGVHGKLVDLCRPTQRKYEEAVATTLGRHMDAIVVEDQKTAIDCIQYMREQRTGTATFLPLNSLNVSSINDRFRNYTRGARLAFDVVHYEKQYERVVQYACGNTLVCDTLAIAKQICFDKNEDVKTVTLEGAVIHRSGLMTGGQNHSQRSKRWSERDVDSLMRTRDRLMAELNELSKNKRMGSAEEQAKSDCAGLQSQMSVLQDEITTAEHKVQGIDIEAQHLQTEIAQGEPLFLEASARLDTLNKVIEQMEASLAVIEDQVFVSFCSRIGVSTIREYESLQFGLSDKITEQRAQFTAQRSRLETQLSFEKDQLKEMAERLARMERMYAQDTESLSQLQTEQTNMSQRVGKISEDLAQYSTELDQQTQLEDEKYRQINQLRRDLESKGKDVDSYLKEMAEYETEIEKMHAKRVSIFRKCKLEDIELPLTRGTMADVLVEDIATQNTDSMDLDEPSQRSIRSTDWVVEINYNPLTREQRADSNDSVEREFLADIKQRSTQIEQMAPNLKAIHRLEGGEQRLQDAEEAFDTARMITKQAKEKFNTVKQKRYTRFYDAFSHISEKIDRVYKDLTKSATFPLGGTAYLSLEDSDEPYLEGIKYHAMPPMKRFRDMELLSGGEKSVAALALLLAIHSYQPSPFFVLDEVDAALDNTNVSLVANYIREHASDTFQFIVISLKNTLYEKATSLVGIYRDQEANSSKTLTLMLDQYAH
ncbi:RecF/RecN/SMC [Spinellus fusiger]|nr:RecF/RecN/SMC [Spinellus fusiger]